MNKEKDTYLKEGIVITLSVTVGALISLYINNRYGANILENLKTSSIFDILGKTFILLAIFGSIILFLWITKELFVFVAKMYMSPVEAGWKIVSNRFPSFQKVKNGITIDLQFVFSKRPYFIKLISIFCIYTILNNLPVLLVSKIGLIKIGLLQLYTFICLIYFIYKNIQYENNL